MINDTNEFQRTDTIKSDEILELSASSSNSQTIPLIFTPTNLPSDVLISKLITQVIESDNHTYQIIKSPGPPPPSNLTTLTVTSTTQSENILMLKMSYATPNKRLVEIRFPFNLVEDTATDVVNEMVNEDLVDLKDEQMARRKIEEVVRAYLIQTRKSVRNEVNQNANQLISLRMG